MPSRLLLFLYGRKNLAGSVLALLGLALLFAGLIKKFWLFIVVGLYTLGYLLTPAERGEQTTAARLDADRIEDALDDLIRAIRRKVPAEILSKVTGIRDSILAMLPDFQQLQGVENGYQIHVIKETALVYLPDMLGSYLKLPAAFARLHPVKGGKTANQVLLEQLDLLDAEMKKIVVDLHRRDMDALVAHGRFLKEKFSKGEWDLG
jgi:hypothetical protein